MVCVRQLVQDHRRMLEQLGSGEELSGYWDVDFASQSDHACWPVTTIDWDVLHGLEPGMILLNPYFELTLQPSGAWGQGC